MKLQGKYNKSRLQSGLILDLATHLSNAKAALNNAASVMKQANVNCEWEPAAKTLEGFATICILGAYFGGTPEKSKATQDGCMEGRSGRILDLEALSEAAGSQAFC